MCSRTKGGPEATAAFSVEAAGQMYNQTIEFVYLGRKVNHNADPSIEVEGRIRNVWCDNAVRTASRGVRVHAPLRHAAPSPPLLHE